MDKISNFFVLLSRSAFLVFLFLSAFVFIGACQEQESWDAGLAAKVNGRPVSKATVEIILERGFYPDMDQGGERDINIPLIIDKLINEELILDEAAKAGVFVSSAEVEGGLADLSAAWFGSEPSRSEQAELRQVLTRHLLLKKMTEKIMAERQILSADKWRDFWAKWPKARTPSFQVQALLLPPSEEAPEIPEEAGSLEELADIFRNKAQAVILSPPIWLSGERLDLMLVDELSRSFRTRRFTAPIRLDESWAVYEVMEIEAGPGAAEEFASARRAFEDLAGEEAFQVWLAGVRAAAKVEYAPSLVAPPSAQSK